MGYMTNGEIQKLILRNIDMQAIEEEITELSGRSAEIVLTNDTLQRMRLRLNNPLQEFAIEVKIN